jgi:hypothetical protein
VGDIFRGSVHARLRLTRARAKVMNTSRKVGAR